MRNPGEIEVFRGGRAAPSQASAQSNALRARCTDDQVDDGGGKHNLIWHNGRCSVSRRMVGIGREGESISIEERDCEVSVVM